MSRRRLGEISLTAPSFLWLVAFFVVPTVIVILVSFRTSDSYGNITSGWTLDAYRAIRTTLTGGIVRRTITLSVITTVVCIAVGLPAAYAMARLRPRTQEIAMLLLIVPFWTNFLIRIYAWKVLLHPDGPIKHALVWLGLIAPDATLLYTPGAVLLVLIYTYIPFAILPMYSAAERFDFGLLEAARDLGSSPVGAFVKVFIPGISTGIISAIMVVLIPALGSYIIPEIVGGPGGEMLGTKIAQRVFVSRSLPRASALSSMLLLVILLPSLISLTFRRRGGDAAHSVGGAL
jgi:spermidine/putrescine transport system permease protein